MAFLDRFRSTKPLASAAEKTAALADPDVRISTGSRRSVPARARRLAKPQADSVLQSYIARRPRAWATLKVVVERSLGHPVSTHETELPVVEFAIR